MENIFKSPNLPNFERLGVKKDIADLFNTHSSKDLQAIIDSEYFFAPYITRRDPSFYANVFVISCKHEYFWYKNLIGFEFFCEIRFRKPLDETSGITDVVGVKLTGTQKITFRSFDPEDVIII